MELFFALLPFVLIHSDEFCSASLDHLLAIHQEFGLPLPPANASLVRYVSEDSVTSVKSKKVIEPGSPCLGFSLDGRTVLGRFNEPCPVASLQAVKPDWSVIGNDALFDTWYFAIACHERGWEPLARASLRQCVFRFRDFILDEDLAHAAWRGWLQQLQDSGTPFSQIAKYLKRIAAQPWQFCGFDQELVRSIELTAQSRTSAPGSDEALIDDLTQINGSLYGVGFFDDKVWSAPQYRAVIRRGFAIVPTLIAHLDDDRITRSLRYDPGLDNKYHLRVKDIVIGILAALAGHPFWVPEDTLPERIASVQRWFLEAKQKGEEPYVLSHIFGTKDNEELNTVLFWLLTDKYPYRLPAAYRNLIDNHPGLEEKSWQFARAIGESPLLYKEKYSILLYAAKHAKPCHSCPGIKYLRTIDPKLAKQLLLSALESMPVRSRNRETMLAWVVSESADPDEWAALARATRGTDVGTRLELLQMAARREPATGRPQRLAFLASYLTDDMVRDVNDDPDRYRGFTVPGGAFPRIEVRNFAAMKLAAILKISVDADTDWTEQQWAELRKQAHTALEREIGR